jgi:hypothetical protein
MRIELELFNTVCVREQVAQGWNGHEMCLATRWQQNEDM